MAKKWGEQILDMEQRFFVGREGEQALFRSYLFDHANEAPILNIHGTGGIGKSSLLSQFRSISEQVGVPFLMLDSRDFSHTPQGFAMKLLNELNQKTVFFHDLVPFTIAYLNQLSENNRLVLAIDTYEEMDDLDHWFRESFLVELKDHIVVILAGRIPLQGPWRSSVAWRNMIRYVRLVPFDFQTSKSYALNFNPSWSRRHIEQLHTLSHGHPLTLSLLMQITAGTEKIELLPANFEDISDQLLSCWLRELKSPSLRALLEAASMVRVFNQELLESVLDSTVASADFDHLTGLSFILRSNRGWFIHDGLREALSRNFKLRKPKIYRQLWERSIAYLYRQIPEQALNAEAAVYVSDFMYVLGDTTIRAAFLDGCKERNFYFETVNENNADELSQYIQSVLNDNRDFIKEYVDHETHRRHVLEIPKAILNKSLSFLDPRQFIALGGDVVRLMKNERHEAVALIVFIPIHEGTLPFLEQSPVSKHYFRTLTKRERLDYAVPSESPAGLFLYHIDLWKAPSAEARHTFFQLVMSYLLKGGTFLISSPIQYYQEVVKSLGFVEVPGATHKDFGEQYPAPTLKLDLNGVNLKHYVKGFAEKAGVALHPSLPEGAFHLTPREREIAMSAITCSSISEIANQLHVAEITVKKHLGRIYEKTGVKGKTELIKKLMSL